MCLKDAELERAAKGEIDETIVWLMVVGERGREAEGGGERATGVRAICVSYVGGAHAHFYIFRFRREPGRNYVRGGDYSWNGVKSERIKSNNSNQFMSHQHVYARRLWIQINPRLCHA